MTEKEAATPQAAWRAFIEGLERAGAEMEAQTQGLSPEEQADGYRALVRALNNQLGRFEVDRANPELQPFNGWRQKFFMDNPDFLYWVADIDANRSYRIRGTVGDAVHSSITAYAAGSLADAHAASRIDQADMALDANGGFELIAAREKPADGAWLPLPEKANAIWVRGFYDDIYNDRHGTCSIEPLDPVPAPPMIDPGRLAHQLQRLGKGMAGAAKGMKAAADVDLARPNQVRVWEEMQGGAVFTEPNIHYQRGAWSLAPDEALVIEGETVPCLYWNVMLYSRFLNTLDHRHRTVSLTGKRAQVGADGSYRMVLAGRDPGVANWLDTEGRSFGIFVFRWLRPEREPDLPRLRVEKLKV